MQLKIIMIFDNINVGDIAYKQIDGKYWFGQYGDFNVVLDKESGYINVSKLCRDGGKKFKHWTDNKSSKELIAAFSLNIPEAGIPASQNDWLIRKIITQQHAEQDKLIFGSYAHPDLVPHIASWVSAPFARMVSKITNNFLFGQYKSCLAEKQAQLNEEQALRQHEVTRRQHAEEWARQEKAGREATTQILQITEQQVEIMKRELAYADEEVREKDRVLEDKNVEMMEKDKALDDQNVEIARQSAELAVAGLNLLTTKNELGGAKCKIIKSKTNLFLWSCTHSFVIMKVNDENARGAYYVIRTRRRTIRAAMKRFTNKHPNATIMFEQRFIPNGVNLYQRLKVQRLIKTHHNFFNIMTCEHGLVKAIDAMNANESRPPVVNYSDPCS